jgi:hypothetical protein
MLRSQSDMIGKRYCPRLDVRLLMTRPIVTIGVCGDQQRGLYVLGAKAPVRVDGASGRGNRPVPPRLCIGHGRLATAPTARRFRPAPAVVGRGECSRAGRGARRRARRPTALTVVDAALDDLVFPGHAPSRMRVALQASLKQRLGAVETRAGHDTAQEHAEHLVTMVAALSRHDRRTIGHSERTRAYAALLADEVGLDAAESAKLQGAALPQDIGKLDVPAAILNKPGAVDDDERAVISGHPAAGEQRAAPLLAWLGPWANGIWQHHEKVDGTEYPLGLGTTRSPIQGACWPCATASRS